MDEIFGYLPPVANPPSKKPLLTLLKQARAFGLGVVLATQNPVDLDYKALSNIGTWFLGRLQTERDKARVLDGLEGASAASGAQLRPRHHGPSALGPATRVFLIHNVHEEAPQLMETRWALSYLAGPLDRAQLRRLSGPAPVPAAGAEAVPAAKSATGKSSRSGGGGTAPAATRDRAGLPAGARCRRFARLPSGGARCRPGPPGEPEASGWPRWSRRAGWRRSRRAERSTGWRPPSATCRRATSSRSRSPAPPSTRCRAGRRRRRASPSGRRDFADALYRTVKVDLLRSARLDTLSRPGESERDFRIRLADVARDARDQERVRIETRYAPKLQQIEERERRALARVEQEKQQATSRQLDTAISVGATVLGALFGRRKLSATTFSRAASSARSASRTMKESRDVGLAEETVEAVRAQRAALEAEVQNALAELAGRFDPAVETLETIPVKPKKADVEVRRVVLAWVPVTPL